MQSPSTRQTGVAPPAQPPVVVGVAQRAVPPPKPAQHTIPVAHGIAFVALAAVHTGAWQVMGPAGAAASAIPKPPPAAVGWQVSGAVQSESPVQTAAPPFGQPPAVAGAAQVAPANPLQHRSGDVQSVFDVHVLATQVIAPVPIAGALQL